MTKKRSLPPDGSLLNSYANQNLRWWVVCGEFIDNSWDAGAKTIFFDFSPKTVRISDDGNGCADPGIMVQLGGHEKHITTKLGRYGIGAKDAALWLGGVDSTIIISTIHAGISRTLSVNWQEYAMSGWQIDETIERAADVHERGTIIDITPYVKTPPYTKDLRELLDQLGYLYAPGIKEGRQIKIRRSKNAISETVIRWEPPAFDGEHIDTVITVNGRSARVYCGVVKEGLSNARAGFTYWYGWRVIEQASARGCGEYSIAKFCGFVELDSSWQLTKNKDAISKDADALYAEVERISQPILKRADQVGVTIRSNQFQSTVNEQLNVLVGAIGTSKAKRGPGNKEGTQKPTGTGTSHKKAENEQGGDRFASRRIPQLNIDYIRLDDQDSLGQFKPPQILLNLTNPIVAQSRRQENSLAIVILAASLIGIERCFGTEKSGQMRLPVDFGISPGGINKSIGSILSSELEFGGRSLTLIGGRSAS